MQPLLEAADFVVIPVQPTPNDLRAVGPTVQAVKTVGRDNFCFVVTRGVAGAKLTIQTPLLFSVLAIGSLWYFRSRLMAIFQRGSPDEPVDALVGQSCRTLGALVPRGAGQVELRGSAWAALNGTDRAIAPDARCRVVQVNGLTLHVEPEGGSV